MRSCSTPAKRASWRCGASGWTLVRAPLVAELTVIQSDPVEAVARSADLVAWGRMGELYRRGDLDAAVRNGSLVEIGGLIRPMADVALLRAEMLLWRDPESFDDWRRGVAAWAVANDRGRREILRVLHLDGPLPAGELPDLVEVPWRSSGWNNRRNVQMLLGVMERRGEVVAVARSGKDRLWDLAERVYADIAPVPVEEANHLRDERRLSALGIARGTGGQTPGEPNSVGSTGVAAKVEGVRGAWRVDETALAAVLAGAFVARTVLLSPLDRLVYDRKRMTDLFAFDYQLEMFKPAAKRRWGYWALPILSGDELIGKLDATADLADGALFVDAVHEDGSWSIARRRAVDAEIAALADWLGVQEVRAGR